MKQLFAGHCVSALLVILALAGLPGCNHSPVGFDQMERGIDTARFFVPPLVSGSGRSYGKYNDNNSLGRLDNLILGRNREYESRVLVRFALDDSAPKLDSVDSIRFVVHTRTLHAIPFSVYAINTEWDEFHTNWHDAQTGQPWFTPGGDYDSLRPLRTDTITADSTVIILPRSALDTLVHGTYGLVLIPQSTDSGRFASLYSRTSTDRMPTLTYLYGKKRRRFDATQTTYVVDTLGLDLQPGRLWMGSGYVFRSYLKFNLDSLVSESASTVITGALTIHPDTAFSERETLQIGVHRLTRSYEPAEQNAPFAPAASAVRQYIVRQDTTLNLDIRSLIQFWALQPDSNFGLLLTLEPENFDVSRVELKRGKVPSLRVGYVRPPHGRF